MNNYSEVKVQGLTFKFRPIDSDRGNATHYVSIWEGDKELTAYDAIANTHKGWCHPIYLQDEYRAIDVAMIVETMFSSCNKIHIAFGQKAVTYKDLKGSWNLWTRPKKSNK